METNKKKATSFSEQVEILKSRGVVIEDDYVACKLLKRINYYRFSAYLLGYKIDDNKYEEVSFDEICQLYNFDKCLRSLIFNNIENIEIAFRTHISYLLGHKYGPYGYKENKNFRNKEYHKEMLEGMTKDVERSKEIFIQHHKRKYNSKYPIWVIIEVLSFGELSKLYSNLLPKDQNKISKDYYNMKSVYLRNWLQSLTVIRNRCAHHSRLFNRKLDIPIKLFESNKDQKINSDTLFALLYTIVRLSESKEKALEFIENLDLIFIEFSKVRKENMGFPKDWKIILLNLTDNIVE